MTRRRLIAPVVVALALLTGCSGGGPATPAPPPTPGRAANATPSTAATPVTFTCEGAVSREALPAWARGGFRGDTAGYPHVIAAQGHLVAVLFSYPPKASTGHTVQNKILWVGGAGDPATGPEENPPALRIRGRLADGTTMSSEVAGGPGPSYVSFPRKGCWHLELSWWGRHDRMAIPVS